MEPNWQQGYQNTQKNRQAAWGQTEGERPQRPLGTGGDLPRQERYIQPQRTAPQASQPQSTWQTYPPQSSAAPTPSNPWVTGPVDPFDEPAEAPELREARSEHLYNKEDRFWDHVEEKQSTGKHRRRPSGRKAESHTLRWIVLILVVMAVVGGVVYGAVFRVREITVQGGITIAEQEIIRLSGVHQGMNTFAIDDDLVEKNIESNRYLSFVCVDKKLPDKVIIQVKERIPAAAVKYCGILYTVDNRGMVLEESESLEAASASSLIAVDGMYIHDCRVGQTLTLDNPEQMKTFTEILVELKVMSALNMVKELNLSDMDNLFVETEPGYAVRLGSAENMHAKLRSMLLTVNHLRREGYQGGTIDVSAPVNPTYIPEN